MFGWIALGVTAVTLGAGVLYWIKSYLNNRVALDQRTAALRVESERVDAMERAAAAEKAARDREFDAEKAAVRDADGAADLLRRQFPGTR